MTISLSHILMASFDDFVLEISIYEGNCDEEVPSGQLHLWTGPIWSLNSFSWCKDDLHGEVIWAESYVAVRRGDHGKHECRDLTLFFLLSFSLHWQYFLLKYGRARADQMWETMSLPLQCPPGVAIRQKYNGNCESRDETHLVSFYFHQTYRL